MDGLISAGLLNAALATLLAGVAFLVTAAWKNPYVARLAWLAVLLKLLTPPLLFVPVEVAWLQPSTESTPPITVEPIAIERSAAIKPNDSQPLANNEAKSATTAAPQATTSSIPTTTASHAQHSITASTAVLPAPLPPTTFSTLHIIALTWLTGSLLLSALAITRILRLHRCLARDLPSPAAIQQRTAALAAELGLRAPPNVCIVAGRVAPFAWSLGRRATIVLPATLVATLDADALDAVIAHELTHLRRRDGWARWLELAATLAYWWCPTAWFARRRLHAAEEECCDADVLRRFPALRRGYGQALLQTLDLLAGDAPLAPGATGWGSRRSLRRRFERIGTPVLPTTLRPTSRCIGWGAIALVCIASPLIASEEQTPAESSTKPQESLIGAPPDFPSFSEGKGHSQRCTITLEDGSTIRGVLVNDDERRLIVERSKIYSTRAEAFKRVNDHSQWGLSLEECIQLALLNHPNFRTLRGGDADGPLTLAQRDENRQSLTVFETQTARLVKDVTDKYWELAQCYRIADERRKEQNAALSISSLARSKSESRKDAPHSNEKTAHDLYSAARERGSASMTELYAAESELRWLLGLAQQDGRLIKPNSSATVEEPKVDWHAVHEKALANRVELREQKKRVLEQQRRLRSTQESAARSDNAAERRELEIKASHCQMLAEREEGVLERMERSIGEPLGAALRNVAMLSGTPITHAARERAMTEEASALRDLFNANRVSIDVLLIANERQANEACARHRSQMTHQHALTELDFQQGTLLETYNIRIAE